MCRISKISDDWITKGFHIHVFTIELVLRPDHQGGVIFRRCFSRDSAADVDAAIAHAERLHEDSAWRGRFLRVAERALEYVNERAGAGDLLERLVGRAKEFRFLIVALKRLVEAS